MEKRRVLLICTLPLLCEGLQRIFGALDDVELVCLECADPQVVESCLRSFQPGTVVIAGERADDAATHLISNVLNYWPDIPVVWIELETNVIRVYTSHTLPANSRDLLDAVRRASFGSYEGGAQTGPRQRS